MTVERAIQILDPEHREHYESIELVNEACRMGMEALKRTQWVSVKDRLPDASGTYLVCTDRLAVMTTHYWTKDYRFAAISSTASARRWTTMPSKSCAV